MKGRLSHPSPSYVAAFIKLPRSTVTEVPGNSNQVSLLARVVAFVASAVGTGRVFLASGCH